MRLAGRDCAAVDHDLGSGDGSGAGGVEEEGDQVRHFPGLGGATEGNAAEGVHDDLLPSREVGSGRVGHPLPTYPSFLNSNRRGVPPFRYPVVAVSVPSVESS